MSSDQDHHWGGDAFQAKSSCVQHVWGWDGAAVTGAAALRPHKTRKYGQSFALLFFLSHVILFLDCYFGAGFQPR